ncbi:MAG: glycosyltransferase [Verrucomicrobiota bacterium]
MGEPVSDAVEISVVMPCLNEADTLEACIRKAQDALSGGGIRGEIIVADNGSTDGSQAIAERLGARMVAVERKGYGYALMGGIEAARGRYVLMGDADDSYDFRELAKFVKPLRDGCDLAQGCRLPAGGGRIAPGAMPWSHRWIGNPLFSALSRWWFRAPIHDVYCGMRAFTKDLFRRLDLRCAGMEFATEMIIKASLHGAKMAEVPITLHRDGRKSHEPHLNTMRDGWRTLRFFLIYCPRWLFFVPGLLLILLGLVGYGLALPGLRIARIHFDAHTLLFASVFMICGYQAILFSILAKTFAVQEGLVPEDPRLARFFSFVSLEKGLLIGFAGCVVGAWLLLAAVNRWRLTGFADLDYASTMRWVVPGVTLLALGFHTILSSFFVSILGMRRR